MSDIFRDMQSKLGCRYISDLPDQNGRYGMNFVVCPLRDTGEKQLEDFARYVFGVRYSVLKEVMDMLETEPDFATQ